MSALPLPASHPSATSPDALLSVRGRDDLLQCLVILTRLHRCPVTAISLTAGLPLEKGRLTPELFLRAAQRAGLKAHIATRALQEIPDAVLPVVLLLRDSACVLVQRKSHDVWQVIMPANGPSEQGISTAVLQNEYAGLCILTTAEAQVEERIRQMLDLDHPDAIASEPQNWFWKAVKNSWPIYGEVLIASVFINLFALAIPLFSMNIYDRVVPNNAQETLWVLSIGAVLVLGFDFLIRVLRGNFLDLAGKRIDILLSSAVFERVLGIRMRDRPASVGAFASSLQEFEGVREFMTSASLCALIDLPFVAVFILMVFWIGGDIGWVPLLILPVIIGVSLLLRLPLTQLVRASVHAVAQRQAHVVETLLGLETLKTHNAEGAMQSRFERILGDVAELGLRTRKLSGFSVHCATLLQQLGYVAVIFFGAGMIAAGELSMGALIACTILTGRALAPLSQVASLLVRQRQSLDALASTSRLMNLGGERDEYRTFIQRPPLRGGIEFRDVSFTYPGRQEKTLSGISFRITPGERIGLIGRVGSGKTTLEKLILGLYTADSGAVLLDGIDVRQIDPAALRQNIGYVPQEIQLFYGSIRDNIALGKEAADDASILHAARIAGVSEFVDSLPEGYDRMVGEQGEGLSGGQRQAIAIARAELHTPPLLILDEPTSAMDQASEENFKTNLLSELAGRTLLVISHRPSLLTLVDRLIVVEQGRVVADGPKQEVIAMLGRKIKGARHDAP